MSAERDDPARGLERVEVWWADSCNYAGWVAREDAQRWGEADHHDNVTVGFLIREDGEAVVVVRDVSPDQLGETMKIPASCVREIYRLERRRRRGKGGASRG